MRSGKGVAIHPRDEVAVVAVDEPVFDATGIEGDDGQRVTHDFKPDGGDGFGPHTAEGHDAAFAVVGLQFFLGDEAFEMNAIARPSLRLSSSQ
jgi:hypothetical protein